MSKGKGLPVDSHHVEEFQPTAGEYARAAARSRVLRERILASPEGRRAYGRMTEASERRRPRRDTDVSP